MSVSRLPPALRKPRIESFESGIISVGMGITKFGTSPGFSCGHCAAGARVAVEAWTASNVGVKVGEGV